MDNLTKAADDLKRLAGKFKGIVELAETLEQIGSFEQAAREATARREGALAEEKRIRETLEALNEKIKGMDDLIHQRRIKAEQIIKAANEKALEIVKDGEGCAKKIVEDAERSEKVIYEETLTAKVSLEVFQKSIRTKEAELLEIKGQIQTAKDKIASL